eukprot:scaffold9747_cov157-Skeletonema_marinoi.AAC.5
MDDHHAVTREETIQLPKIVSPPIHRALISLHHQKADYWEPSAFTTASAHLARFSPYLAQLCPERRSLKRLMRNLDLLLQSVTWVRACSAPTRHLCERRPTKQGGLISPTLPFIKPLLFLFKVEVES